MGQKDDSENEGKNSGCNSRVWKESMPSMSRALSPIRRFPDFTSVTHFTPSLGLIL